MQSLRVCSTFKEFIIILDVGNAELEMKVARNEVVKQEWACP